MTPEFLIVALITVSLLIYALTGGADFGGGAWTLFARGPRSGEQKKTIEKAIAPVWETNHVWIILVIVVLFITFPLAFFTISVALHIPITLMLIGIVLRGSAFVFQAYGLPKDQKLRQFWGNIFGISSLLTPIMLGVIVGAIASGEIRVDVRNGQVKSDFFSSWLGFYPFCIGVFVLVSFMFLSAVYLLHETDNKTLQEDFRKRALLAAIAVDVLAMVSLVLSKDNAPILWRGLYQNAYALWFHLGGGVMALAIFYCLYAKKYQLLRVLAVTKVGCIVGGWAFSQFPYLVVPDVTLYNSAAPSHILVMVLVIAAVGMVVTVPAIVYLFRIFKK